MKLICRVTNIILLTYLHSMQYFNFPQVYKLMTSNHVIDSRLNITTLYINLGEFC